jgi:beta-D-xylosidase 4
MHARNPTFLNLTLLGYPTPCGYSRETDRMGSQGNVSMWDLWDTYTPQYEEAMTESFAAGTMCSYFSFRIEGAPGDVYIPSCANPYMLTQVIREYWGRPDAVHLSDCGAVVNMFWPTPRGNGYTNGSLVAAAAVALNAGMDQNSNTISPSHLWLALEQGLTTQDVIYAAAGRVLAQRFRLGQFDPLESLDPQLLRFGAADIGTAASREAAAEGVRQGAVLLKNGGGAVPPPLPLAVGSRILVVGPTSASVTAAIGDIYGSSGAVCPDGSNDCWPLVGEAIALENVGGTTLIIPGINMLSNDTQNWGAAIAAASSGSYDSIILCLGTDRSVAGEGTDRSDIGLPGVQENFALAVLNAAALPKTTPVVLVLVHNLPVSFDALLSAAAPPSAIVDTWAPTTNSGALAELLFGKVNKWGRSTLTVYPRAYQNSVSLLDMGNAPSATNAGRSYRYYDGRAGAPLVRFGEGLSGYSQFALACARAGGDAGTVTIDCNVTHARGPAGDEVLMLFHRPGADVVAKVGGAHPLPLLSLRDFTRLSVPVGNVVGASFTLPLNKSFAYVNQDGASVLYSGTHFIDVYNGNTENVTLTVNIAGDDARVIRAPPRPW